MSVFINLVVCFLGIGELTFSQILEYYRVSSGLIDPILLFISENYCVWIRIKFSYQPSFSEGVVLVQICLFVQ